MDEQPLLSIIIPAYNEEQRLPRSLESIVAFIEEQPYPIEVLIVENGSRDRTLEIAEQFAASDPQVRVMRSPKGKGAAVRAGMMAGQGRYLFMADSDLSMPIDEDPQVPAAAVGWLRRCDCIAGRTGRASLTTSRTSAMLWGGSST